GVVYRAASGRVGFVPFERTADGDDGYVAIIPADAVRAPGVGYAIELDRTDGQRVAVFGSRAEPYPVEVVEDRMDARERALDKRLGGRRSVFTATGEYVLFGTTEPSGPMMCRKTQSKCVAGEVLSPERAAVNDQYYRIEGSYAYRPLRTVAEFGIRGGV